MTTFSSDFFDNLKRAIDSVPKSPVSLSYGTAGFRSRAENLDAIFLKVGMLAALRSIATKKVSSSISSNSFA